MRSQNKSRLVGFTTMALMVSMATVLSYFERFIPVLNVPGVKLGLANVITMLALVFFSWKEALFILVARVLLTSFFAGSAVSLLYSMSGGLVSLFGMALALRFHPKFYSVIGVSLIGAFLHNSAQAVVLALILGSTRVALGYYPILVGAALLTGAITGYIARLFLRQIQSTPIAPKN